MMKQNQQTKGKYKSGRLELAPGGKDKDNDPEIAIEFGPALAAALPADDTTATGGEMKAQAPPSGKDKPKHTRKRRKKLTTMTRRRRKLKKKKKIITLLHNLVLFPFLGLEMCQAPRQ